MIASISEEYCVVRLTQQMLSNYLSYRVYELSDLNLQKALSITMGDLLFVGRAHWELVQEIAR
jgi:hypothetical protein